MRNVTLILTYCNVYNCIHGDKEYIGMLRYKLGTVKSSVLTGCIVHNRIRGDKEQVSAMGNMILTPCIVHNNCPWLQGIRRHVKVKWEM